MTIDTGDTAWLLISAALVMLMTPALGFFYGGLVGKKNVLSTLTHSFFILCLISVQWVLWGYSLSFSPDSGAGIIGGLGWGALAALDSAGAAVVHGSSGVSPLVAAILIGRRLKTSEPHDATMTILGASLL